MESTPAISEAEWKVMKLLWAKSPQPSYDLIAQLTERENWTPSTVKTLLSRLQRKKAIHAERYKNLFHYSPTVTESDCVARETDSLLDRLFGGAVGPLLLHFASRQKVTPTDLESLRRTLKERQPPKE